MFKITLADGSELSGLELNGNNFISKTEITPTFFTGKLSRVKIEAVNEKEDENSRADFSILGEHTNMQLVRAEYDNGLGGWAFILRDLTQSEIREENINARLDYIEMMEDLA